MSARFSLDGRRVVTASRDHTARLWDAQTGLPISDPLLHPEAVQAAEFSPDGTKVLTACRDGVARIWEVSPAPVPVPAWWPRLIEALAGQRVEDGRTVHPAPGEFGQIKRQVKNSPASDPYADWARRLLGE